MTQQEKKNMQQEIQVQIPPDIQKGTYANNMMVAHTQEEFILDFILLTPPSGTVNARVIVSPAQAKRIAAVLADNISKYESNFGEIVTAQPIPAGPAVSH